MRILIGAILFFIGLFFYSIHLHLIETERCKNLLGTKVVLDKDTLTIVDYGIFTYQIKLSNGIWVSESSVITP